ncbi:MAG TPA: response regulator [Sphingomicrobium sp.]|jgi:CheY-like chemotaxis protein|nr:response regulator [Sphingomicrobium sp.]
MNPFAGEIPVALRPAEKDVQLTDFERARVLLVDDDERNLMAVATVLEDLGEVVLARSGEEALRFLLRGEFAVILLDVYMPGMDGYETAQIIRGREQTKGIPIVFLSAVNKEAEHQLRGYSMGAVDYVFKPVDPIILRSKVAVFVELFEKSKEVQRQARQEQALLDANLRANADRLRAEQELRRAEQRQAVIIQSLPMVVYLEPYEAVQRSPSYVGGDLRTICGFTLDEFQTQPEIWKDRLHPDDRIRVIAALEARRRNGRSSIEYRWMCADGTYKNFLDQAVLLRDSDGKPIEFAGTLTDISEQRSLESQLIQAQKMDAIGKLTGGIAHDFNNLLAAVIGGLGLLDKRARLDEDGRKILAMTIRAAEQGSDLVRRLLAFARRQKLEPQSVDLASLQESVWDLLTHTLGGLVKLEWSAAAQPWNAFADQAQLELALINLIINARDAMPAGGTVSVTVENHELNSDNWASLAPGKYVLLSVTDTGTGISPENLEKVMEPFFTTKETGKGSGLGLSMVYGFAKQSNGAFRLASELEQGTRAELWLPRAGGIRPQNKKPQSPEPQQKSSCSLRVLLVDDHAEVRSTTAAVLADFGHNVVEAANGADALTALGDGDCKYDAMITDYAMPNLSGTEFLREARKICPDVPALLITGYADAEAIDNRPDGVEVMLKPFTPHQLEEALSRLRGAAPQ